MSNTSFFENLNEKMNFFQLFTTEEDHHPAYVEQLVSDYKNSDDIFKYNKGKDLSKASNEAKAMHSLGEKIIAIEKYTHDFSKFLRQGDSKLVLGFVNYSPYVAFDHSLNIKDSDLVLVLHKNEIISPLEFAKQKYVSPVKNLLKKQYDLAERHLPEDLKTSVNKDTVQKFVNSYIVNNYVLNELKKA